jgi:hypothetical protein
MSSSWIVRVALDEWLQFGSEASVWSNDKVGAAWLDFCKLFAVNKKRTQMHADRITGGVVVPTS